MPFREDGYQRLYAHHPKGEWLRASQLTSEERTTLGKPITVGVGEAVEKGLGFCAVKVVTRLVG